MTNSLPVVVTYEDRPEAFPGAELLARSLSRHAPEMDLIIYSPAPEIAARLTDLPRVHWRETRDLVGRGWNVKPVVLLRALEEHKQVLWLDTDIVVTGDLAAVATRFAPDYLIVGEDFHGTGANGGDIRARGHGLVPMRQLPLPVNSGSMIFNRQHAELLTAWAKLLAGDTYRTAQKLSRNTRPPALYGDQDVLWGLLVSECFADLPVDFFRTGTDMLLHCGANGYHLRDRMRVLRGAQPAFVHMLGQYKPWSFKAPPAPRRRPREYIHLVAYELSPFFEAAKLYSKRLHQPAWLHRRTWLARGLNALCLGNVALRGLPLAAVASLAARYHRR